MASRDEIKLADFTEQLRVVKQNIVSESAVLATTLNELAEAREAIKAANASLVILVKTVQAVDESITSLKKEAADLTDKHRKDVKAKNKEIAELEKAIQKLKTQQEEAQTKTKDATAEYAEIAAVRDSARETRKEEIAAHKKEITILKKEVADLKREKNQLEKTTEKKRNELDADIIRKTATLEEVARKVVSIELDHADLLARIDLAEKAVEEREEVVLKERRRVMALALRVQKFYDKHYPDQKIEVFKDYTTGDISFVGMDKSGKNGII